MTTCVCEEPLVRSDTMSDPAMDLLRGLPCELLYHIGDLLSPKSLNNLARTSKSISSVYTPRLYRQHDRLASQWAAENGETYTARRAMQYSKDPKGLMDEILLPTAVVKGHEDLVEFLISKGADLNRPDDNGLTPLAAAAQFGRDYVVELLISRGADINQKTSDGMTALAMAITNKQPDVVMLLMQQKGIDLGYETNGGIDVLQVAIKFRHYPGVDQLLQDKAYRHAHINIPFQDDGLTPLITAVKFGRDNDILELLINHGANINQKTSDGITPLAMALRRKQSSAILLLVQQEGIDLTYETNDGMDVFQMAIEHGYHAVVDQLLRCETYRRAHINTPFHNGLSLAASQFGDNVFSGPTPLVTASYFGRDDIRELLISHGADIDQNINGDTGNTDQKQQIGYRNAALTDSEAHKFLLIARHKSN